jgi:hypothetical protein
MNLLQRLFGRRRVRPGDRCPCRHGQVYQTSSPRHGLFLGCTNFVPGGRGCNNAWTIDGRRLPPQARRGARGR